MCIYGSEVGAGKTVTMLALTKSDIIPKLNILKSFDKALGKRQLTDYQLLDMRYNKQLIAREWS